jgi:hypothetical protein
LPTPDWGIPQSFEVAENGTNTAEKNSDPQPSGADSDAHASPTGKLAPGATALVGQSGTSALMPHGLNTRLRTATRVAAIRAPYPGVDALAPATVPPTPGTPTQAPDGDGDGGAGQLATVVHLADRAPRPARDGATRHGQIAPIDPQNRVSLGKALSALGWTSETFLVAAREDRHTVVRAAADSPLLTRVPVDAQRRLTLPPAVLAGLDVGRGDQVVAVAVTETAELHLFAAGDALQLLTGALPAAATDAAPEPAPRAAGGSRVKARWAAGDCGAPRPAGDRAEG